MTDWKKLLKRIIFIPLWLMIVLAVISTAALIAVFAGGLDTSPIAYFVYVLAFYSLTVICVCCSVTLPRYYRSLKQKVYGNKFGNRFLTDVVYKTHVTLYISLTVNLLYVAVNLISGIIYRTVWFGVLAVYYTILAVMRFLLLRYVNRNELGQNRLDELKRSRLCAVILMSVNLALSGAVLMMMYQNKGFEYHGILIYIMAVYTFYTTVTAVTDVVSYRKYNSPVMTTSKAIKLAAALVSMLSLETAMLAQFGGETSPRFKQIMIAATGGGVSIIIVVMAVYMIIRSTIEIRGINNGKQ